MSSAYAIEIEIKIEIEIEIGEILARTYALDVARTHVATEDQTSRDSPELAERATATGEPWAGELTS